MSVENELNFGSESQNDVLSVGNYLIMFLLMAVPIVNIIMLFVWAFGGNVNINKKNCAMALLIMMAISIAVSVLLSGVFAAMLGAIVEGMA